MNKQQKTALEYGAVGLIIRNKLKRHFENELGRPGSVLLSHALRRSTIAAETFHGRVRNGIGCFILANATRSSKIAYQNSKIVCSNVQVRSFMSFVSRFNTVRE